MKRSLNPGKGIAILLLLVSMQTAIAQKAKDIFSADTPLTYFGVDFSEAKVFGETSTSPSDIRKYFGAINQQILNQRQKYNLPNVFHRAAVADDIAAVLQKCGKIDVNKIKTDNVVELNKDISKTVDKIVKAYEYGSHKGIGVLFVVGGMNKATKEATVYITFFSIVSKKVLLTERMSGKAGGFGFSNYWSTAIYNVMNTIETTKYNEWKARNP